MAQILLQGEKKVFDLAEANRLLPLIRRITRASILRTERTLLQLEKPNLDPNDEHALKREYELIVDEWSAKIQKLGALAKGLWIVDFDNGDGYYCWKYPESRITYFHDYQGGFSGRRKLALEPSQENSLTQ